MQGLITPPAGISDTVWLELPTSARVLILQEQQESQVLCQGNEQLRQQLTALASELPSLHERIDRNSLKSSKSPSSDGSGFNRPKRH